MGGTETLFHDPRNPKDPLPIFLLQVMLVLIFTRLIGKVIRYMHQPSVIGEILGGIILGPSVLGMIPGWTDTFFPAWSMPSFTLVANLGLIFFMFFIGMEVDTKQMKEGLKSAAPIAISAIIFPFLTGVAASYWLYDINDNGVSQTSFVLFLGTSMSFTAFPVLAAILHNFQLLDHPVGVLAFSAAAVDDVGAWCVLAIASAFVTSASPLMGVYTTLIAILFAGFMFGVMRPFLNCVHRYYYLPKAHGTDKKTEKDAAAATGTDAVTDGSDAGLTGSRNSEGLRHRGTAASSPPVGLEMTHFGEHDDADASRDNTISSSDVTVEPLQSETQGDHDLQDMERGHEAAELLGSRSSADEVSDPVVLKMRRTHVSIVFLVLLFSAFLSESIGIHAFFGAYIAGVIVPKEGGFVEQLAPKIELVVVDFLLPLFFVNNGLLLHLQAINSGFDVAVMVAIIIIASFGKMFPTLIATKLSTGKSWRFSMTMATLMNTRGLVELVVLNVGLNLGILSQKLFAMMVVMAIVTTAMTPPLVYLLVKSGEGLPYLVNEEEATTASDEEIVERARSVLKGGFDTTTIAGKDLEKHHQHSVTVRQTTDINLVRMDSETFIYSSSIHHGAASSLNPTVLADLSPQPNTTNTA